MAENKEKKVLNVPNLRFPEFEGEWQENYVNEICNEFKSGKAIKADLILDVGTYPVFGGNGLRGYTSTYNHDGLFVLIGRQGALCGNVRSVIGKTYITEHAIAVNGNNKSDTNFLHYLFLQMDLGRFSDQSAQPGLAVNKLLKLKVITPRIDEQRKIANLLRLLDERIATQNKIIEDLKKLKSAIIEWHYRQVEKQNVCIGDLGEPFNVGNLAKEDLTETGMPCVIYGELFTTYGETISQIESHTNKVEGMILSKKGDLLFPSSTTVDAMSLIAPSVINVDGVILGGDMFGIHITPNFNAQYLSYYFNHIAKRQLAKFAKGSTIIHLHYADIEKAKLLLPSLEEQNRMANCLISLDTKINIESIFISLLNSQKAYLLRQMFI